MKFRDSLKLLGVVTLLAGVACGEKPAAGEEAQDTFVQDDVYKDVSPEIPISQGFPLHRASIRGTLQPFNEAPTDSSLYQFVGRLYKAVTIKDAEYLLTVVDENIKFSFGAEGGKQDFLRDWGLRDTPDSSGLWIKLKEVLELGGGFYESDKSLFMAPYIFVGWPDAYDAYTHGVITGTGVRLRDQPAVHGRIMKTLAYDIVKYESNRTPEETRIDGESWPWHEVETLDGQKGWVYGKYFRSPLDHRIGIKRTGQGWRISVFIAGD